MAYRQNKETKSRRVAGKNEKETANRRMESALSRNDEMSFYPDRDKKVKISDDFTERSYEDAYHKQAAGTRKKK